MKVIYFVTAIACFHVACLNAAIVFYHDFSGISSTALDGLSLDVNNQDTQTWNASTTFRADGSVSGSNSAAFLDFTPAAGNKYLLRTSFVANNANAFLNYGFVQNTGTVDGVGSRHLDDPTNGIAWAFYGGDNLVGIYKGPTQQTVLAHGSSTASDFEIILDTTDANNVLISYNIVGSGSTELDQYNAGMLASLGINGVGFSINNGADFDINSFELSIIPESSSYVLLFGLLGLTYAILRRRS